MTGFHPEAEIAFVIGKLGKNISVAEAMNYVFGYAPFFDISVRGLTRRTMFLPKGQDTHAALGPWITTKDEVPDAHNLTVRSWVAGEARQNYNTEYMAYKIPDQIAWLKKCSQRCQSHAAGAFEPAPAGRYLCGTRFGDKESSGPQTA